MPLPPPLPPDETDAAAVIKLALEEYDAIDGSREMAVLGRPAELEEDPGGEELSISFGEGMFDEGLMGRERDSKDRREKSCLRFSKRGRITLSRNEVRTNRRTSNCSPLKKSRACAEVRKGPFPENSRSRGKKTACMYGRMEVKVKSHISTRCGINRSSGIRWSEASRDVKPVEKRSTRSSRMLMNDLFWMQRWI